MKEQCLMGASRRDKIAANQKVADQADPAGAKLTVSDDKKKYSPGMRQAIQTLQAKIDSE
jgi:hypothetical protein